MVELKARHFIVVVYILSNRLGQKLMRLSISVIVHLKAEITFSGATIKEKEDVEYH